MAERRYTIQQLKTAITLCDEKKDKWLIQVYEDLLHAYKKIWIMRNNLHYTKMHFEHAHTTECYCSICEPLASAENLLKEVGVDLNVGVSQFNPDAQ